MRVTVDLQRCRGYATCVVVAPTVFDLNESTNKVLLLDLTPPQEVAARVEEARRSCPVQAITVEK